MRSIKFDAHRLSHVFSSAHHPPRGKHVFTNTGKLWWLAVFGVLFFTSVAAFYFGLLP